MGTIISTALPPLAQVFPSQITRIARNNILYHPKTGLMASTADVKTYLKSVFGASGLQYKQVSKIKFKQPRL